MASSPTRDRDERTGGERLRRERYSGARGTSGAPALSTLDVKQRRLALALSLLVPTVAHADQVHGTRSEQLRETAHVVALRIDHGHATLSVRRTVDNGGPRHDQAMFDLDLPAGAVATGLRTLAFSGGKPIWYEAELMEAEAAAARYRELTGIGGYYPKDPALLSWRSQSHLALQVFPVPPGETKTIEYDLVVPTTYSGGRDRLVLTGLGTASLPAEIVVSPAHVGDALFSDGVPLASGAHVVMGPERTIEIELARRAPPRISGALASVTISGEKTLIRPRIELAPRLSQLPVRADVVIVIDASRSRSAEEVAASATAARAYLSHLPDASVEVLTFDREVRACHGKLVPAAEAIDDLAKHAIERRNGSHLDVALIRAASTFDDRPAAPRRVVVFTDLLTRAAIGPGLVKRTLGKSGALVHVVAMSSGGGELGREDASPWAADARSTGGLVWHGFPAGDEDATKAEYEELARPLRIDHLRYTIDRIELDSALVLGSASLPESMREGEGFVASRILRKPIGAVRVAGELWAEPLSATIATSDDENKRWAALAFGSEHLNDMTEEEMAAIARRGHAVTPVTSLLAIEPGVRPSTEGLEHGGMGLTGVGQGGGGIGFGIGLGRGGARFDGRKFFVEALAGEWKRCGGKGAATLTIETTKLEIAEVRDVTVEREGPRRCLTEATWALALPAGFRAEHQEWSVTLPSP
jgi:hypothetical protein